nr:EndoU domain-containing protein [Paraburkholderia unamae]
MTCPSSWTKTATTTTCNTYQHEKAPGAPSIGVQVSVGSSKSQSQSSEDQTTQRGSNVKGAGTAALVATGAQAATLPSTALAAAAGKVAPQNDVNLASPDRTTHILTGDATGGGHQWPGGPGKSVFPQDWSSSKIMSAVSDIATDLSVPETVQANGRIVKNGAIDGIAIRVDIEPTSKGGGIVTAFPTNVPRNPK